MNVTWQAVFVVKFDNNDELLKIYRELLKLPESKRSDEMNDLIQRMQEFLIDEGWL